MKISLIGCGNMSKNHARILRELGVLDAIIETDEKRLEELEHPGYEMDNFRHPYIGEKYVEFCKNFWLGAIGTGQADGLHMKFLEFAKSYTLPIGNFPNVYAKSSV